MSKLDLTGEFWLPESPERTCWGQLKFRPGARVELKLEGWLSTGTPPERWIDVKAVCGRLYYGQPCVLYDCWAAAEIYFLPTRRYRTTLVSKWALLGTDEPDASQVIPKSLAVRYSQLDQWFENPYTVDSNPAGKPGADFKEWMIKYEPDEFEVVVDYGGTKLDIKTGQRGSVPFAIGPDGKGWSWGYHMSMTSQEPRPLEWLLGAAAAFKECFTLMVGSGTYTLDLTAWLPSEDYPIEVTVLLPVYVPRVIRSERRYFTTTYASHHELMPTYVANWFAMRAEHEVASKAYSELLGSDGLTKELVILRILQTLEHMHSAIWPDQTKRVGETTFHTLRGRKTITDPCAWVRVPA
jgi:hypothetical protein